MRLIDADALINLTKGSKCEQSIRLALGMVSTIDPVKHGHWTWFYTSKLDMPYGKQYTPLFQCSECGHRYESYRRYDKPEKEDADYPNYCENCGAKMDEVTE